MLASFITLPVSKTLVCEAAVAKLKQIKQAQNNKGQQRVKCSYVFISIYPV